MRSFKGICSIALPLSGLMCGVFLMHFSLKLLLVRFEIIQPNVQHVIQLPMAAEKVNQAQEKFFNECGCAMNADDFKNETTEEWPCSGLTRGPHQKVVAFTFFEGTTFDKDKRDYLSGLEENLINMKSLYGPGWTLRLYYDLNSQEAMGQICSIACNQSDSIDLCPAHTVKFPSLCISALTTVYPLLWRFMPILDKNVDVLIVRDLDSLISSREVAAVNQFINSSKEFHIMRDHPNHIQPIMGGLWGVKLTDSRPFFEKLLKRALTEGKVNAFAPRHERNHDQVVLEKYFWPLVRNVSMVHDSYSCQKYFDTKPFPTQRIRNQVGNFVGAVISKKQKIPKPCPVQCRPVDHKDWTIC